MITVSSVLSSIDEGDTALGSVSADESVIWSISGSGVSINTSGVITLDSAADYETVTSHSFTVTATDTASNSETTSTLIVTVTDENDNTPTITSGATGTTLAENSGSGQTVYTITAGDNDAGDTSTYAISGTDAALLSVNTSTGVVSLTANPDYETKSSYSFTVTASDAAGNTSGATTVTFSITDVVEAAFNITSASTWSVSDVGTIYYATINESENFTCSSSNESSNKIDVRSSDCEVKIKGNYSHSQGVTYTFTLSVTGDTSGYTATQNVSITVN